MTEKKQRLWTAICFAIVVICLVAIPAYAEPKEEVIIDGQCYHGVHPSGDIDDSYFLSCDGEDRGLNEPNCTLLFGYWIEDYKLCVLDGYEWGIDDNDEYTIERHNPNQREI